MLIKDGVFELSWTQAEFKQNTSIYPNNSSSNFSAWSILEDADRGLVMTFQPHDQYNWQRYALNAIELPIRPMTIGCLGPIGITVTALQGTPMDNVNTSNQSQSLTAVYCPFLNNFETVEDAINSLFDFLENELTSSFAAYNSNANNNNAIAQINGFQYWTRPKITKGPDGNLIIVGSSGFQIIIYFMDYEINYMQQRTAANGTNPDPIMNFWWNQCLDQQINITPNVFTNTSFYPLGLPTAIATGGSKWRNVFGCPYNFSFSVPHSGITTNRPGPVVSILIGNDSLDYFLGAGAWVYSSPLVPFLYRSTSINIHSRSLNSDTSSKQYTRNINDINGSLIGICSLSQSKEGSLRGGIYNQGNFFCKNIVRNPTFSQVTNRSFCCSQKMEFWFTYGPDQVPLYKTLKIPMMTYPYVVQPSPPGVLQYNNPVTNFINGAYSYLSLVDNYTLVHQGIINSPYQIANPNLYGTTNLATNYYIPPPPFGNNGQSICPNYLWGTGSTDTYGNQYLVDFCRSSPRLYFSFDSCDCSVDDSKRVTSLGKRMK